MKYIYLLLFFSYSTGFTCQAQINATTEDGKSVSLYEDGTWKFNVQVENNIKTIEASNPSCAEYTATLLDERTGLNYQSANTIMLLDEEDESQWILVDAMTSSIPGLKNTIILNLSPFGAGDCIKDENRVTIQFNDGEKLDLDNDAMYNCNNKFMLYFGGIYKKMDELKKLSTKMVSNIKVETQDGSIQKVLSKEQRSQLLKSVQCLMENIE